ncbi:MAG: hypothetical protein RTU09_03260 [Candidatus Thorarchaeota archaeon]
MRKTHWAFLENPDIVARRNAEIRKLLCAGLARFRPVIAHIIDIKVVTSDLT